MFLLVALLLLPDFAVCAFAPPLGINYASGFNGARIIESHPEARGTHHLLFDDTEKYMLIPCNAQRKLFTVQLSREIQLSKVSTVNYEYFSSTVQNFTVVGAPSFPCRPPDCRWHIMGHFQAALSRDVQYFSVPKHLPVRFLRFFWGSSYGTEKWCTMTAFQAYGIDILEDLLQTTISVGDEEPERSEEPQEAVNDTAARVRGEPISLRYEGLSNASEATEDVAQSDVLTRNDTASQCLLGEQRVEEYFSHGPGAVCTPKGKSTSTMVVHYAIPPHKLFKALQNNITRASSQFTSIADQLRKLQELTEKRMQKLEQQLQLSKTMSSTHSKRTDSLERLAFSLMKELEKQSTFNSRLLNLVLTCMTACVVVGIAVIAVCFSRTRKPTTVKFVEREDSVESVQPVANVQLEQFRDIVEAAVSQDGALQGAGERGL